jgi:hypothetical protein
MFDNNLILLIAIGIVIFLIMNINNKYSKKSSRSIKDKKKERFYNVSAPAPSPALNSSDLLYTPTTPTNTPTAPTSNLNIVYDSNLKGIPSTVNSNSTDVKFAADYGQGFSLGIDNKDPRLSKFISQAPPQKTPIISDDLLPKKNESWFETPSVGTKIDDANLLADAIFKTGIDTVGSTRKNPSYDIRGTIANPKFAISPWNNSSYEPDNNLKSLC